MKSIMTPWEAVRFGPVEKEYPTSHMERFINIVEAKTFRECLSMELYTMMLEDKKEYSNLPEWSKNEVYDEGDLVIFYGCVIESQLDNNSELPGSDADPSEPDVFSWLPAKKFDSTCLNDFWEMHLRSYLAFEVSIKSVRKTTHSASAKGIVEHIDMNTGSKSVSRTALIDWKKEVKEDALDLLQEMKYWLIDAYKENDCTVFESIPFVKKSCETGKCNVAAQRSRRMFFRR